MSVARVGVLIFPQVEELDFVGRWERFTMWQQVAGGPDGRIVAGVSAGIDRTLAFIAEDRQETAPACIRTP